VTGYVPALLLTLAVEPPLYAFALRRLGLPWRRGYPAGLLVNASSHPIAWLLMWAALPHSWRPTGSLAVVEAYAVAWEAALLALWLRRDVAVLIGVSFVVNAVSLGLGAGLGAVALSR
jgi:hypothetical protein